MGEWVDYWYGDPASWHRGFWSGVDVFEDPALDPAQIRVRRVENAVTHVYVRSVPWLRFWLWVKEQREASRRDIDALLARAWVETFPDDPALRMNW